MEITLKRVYTSPKYTIGHIYVDGKYVCDTIEDTDRGLYDSMPVSEIAKAKVYKQTAIPKGTYRVTMNVISPKFNQKPYYRDFCGGKVPRILNVKGFDGILIHMGVNENSSAGCVIVGFNTVKGRVTRTQEAFEKLYGMLDAANKKNEKITIRIYSTYK